MHPIRGGLSLSVALCAALLASQAHAATVAVRTPVEAVRAVVRPYYVPGYNFANCTARSPRLYPLLTCPETARLRRRLGRHRLPFSGLPFCRCQSGPRTVRLRLISNHGGVARVDARWEMGPTSFTDTFMVVRRAAGWLVDDEYCLNRPATSVYTARGDAPCAS